jgi:hypothetical protein
MAVLELHISLEQSSIPCRQSLEYLVAGTKYFMNRTPRLDEELAAHWTSHLVLVRLAGIEL